MTITEILQQWAAGDDLALQRLIPLVYDQLRQLAENRLRQEGSVTLQPTELVHETYIRLANVDNPGYRDRLHFYGVAVSQMRRILVDLSRRRNAHKRNADIVHIELTHLPDLTVNGFEFEALDAALRLLEKQDVQQARVVELRFFGDLSVEETAELLNVSASTVKRDWSVAKAWLLRELSR